MQPTGAPGSWQAPAVPVPTLRFAGVGRRFVAYIVDAIILAVINAVILGVLSGMGMALVTTKVDFTSSNLVSTDYNYVALIVYLVLSEVVSAAYFIYLWSTQRASLGMRLLSVQVGYENTGATLSMEQAAMRWAYLALPGAVSGIAGSFGTIGSLLGLLVFIYYIALLVTTYQSPTKQGLHDRWAHTQVVTNAM